MYLLFPRISHTLERSTKYLQNKRNENKAKDIFFEKRRIFHFKKKINTEIENYLNSEIINKFLDKDQSKVSEIDKKKKNYIKIY